MDIRFVPVALAEIQPALQAYISAFLSPIDSFLEDHILASNHYRIVLGGEQIGWTSIHGQALITQFALLPPHKHLGQHVFPLVRKLEEVQYAFVPTCDEFFLAHALDDYRHLALQAYFFQHSAQRPPYQSPIALRYRQAVAEDSALIKHHSGDFFDRLEQRLAQGQLTIVHHAEGANAACVGFGIIDQGRLSLGVASCGMFTVEAQRNQGIGPAIITDLIARCQARDLRPVAGCWYYNHRSKKTLEKAGMFTQTRLFKISY